MALVVDHIQPSKRMYLEVRRGLTNSPPAPQGHKRTRTSAATG